MPGFKYDNRFAHYFGICTYAPDGDDGDKGGDDPAKGGGGGGDKTPPPWASEFGDKFDPDKAWSTIEAQRKSERDLKKAVGDLTKKVEGFESAGKTEQEKLTGENEQLKKRLADLEGRERAAGLRGQVSEEARKAGAFYPEDIFRLVDESELELSDDGKVKNAAAVVAALKKSRPQLFSKAGADAAAGKNNGTPGGNDMNGIIRRAAGRS